MVFSIQAFRNLRSWRSLTLVCRQTVGFEHLRDACTMGGTLVAQKSETCLLPGRADAICSSRHWRDGRSTVYMIEILCLMRLARFIEVPCFDQEVR